MGRTSSPYYEGYGKTAHSGIFRRASKEKHSIIKNRANLRYQGWCDPELAWRSYSEGLEFNMCSVFSLTRAKHVIYEALAGRTAPGLDGVKPEDFKFNYGVHMDTIMANLSKKPTTGMFGYSDEVTPDTFIEWTAEKEVMIESPKGKFRPIKIITCMDQAILTFILYSCDIQTEAYLDKVTELTNVKFFGARHKMSTVSALYLWKKHVKKLRLEDKVAIVSEDIENFFPNMKLDIVEKMLEEVGVSSWTKLNLIAQQKCVMRDQIGLAQGPPSSPKLAVCGLAYILKQTEFKCPADVLVTSYVDDITIIGPEDGAMTVRKELNRAIGTFGLRFKEAKQQLLVFDRKEESRPKVGVKSLGWILGLARTPARKEFKLVITMPKGWLRLGEIVKTRNSGEEELALAKFRGRIQYMKYCPPMRQWFLDNKNYFITRFAKGLGRKADIARQFGFKCFLVAQQTSCKIPLAYEYSVFYRSSSFEQYCANYSEAKSNAPRNETRVKISKLSKGRWEELKKGYRK